jgi:hypothetical protein
MDRAVPRDLLPLPSLLSEGSAALPRRCRRAEQKVARKAATVRRVNETIWSVNELYGRDHVFKGLRPSNAQFEALEHFERLVENDLPFAPPIPPEAALLELLGPKADVYANDTVTTVAPYRMEDVSWPDFAGRADLVQCLPPDTSPRAAEDISRLMLSPSDLKLRQESEGVSRVYWDTELKRNKQSYLNFVSQLFKRQMISFHTTVDSEVGVFFVRKKSGKLRLVIDARSTNQMLRAPPSTSLASTAAVVEFESSGLPSGCSF